MAATRPRSRSTPLPVARSPLVATVRQTLFERCRLAPGDTVVVGVSGGADSMSLMLALAVIAGRSRRSGQRIIPVVAHVHHHLRGRAADLDAAFVETQARRLELPFHRRDVHPAKLRGSRAAAARRLRYQALAEVARETGAAAVAVAHHAEDQLESMLMALARGAGPDGLAGMAWRRPLLADREDARASAVVGDSAPTKQPHQGPALVRPLLSLTKSECEELCRLGGLRWREDRSNRDPSSPRVRLRRQVLPVLEALWPGAARRSVDAGELLRQLADLAAAAAPELRVGAREPEGNPWLAEAKEGRDNFGVAMPGAVASRGGAISIDLRQLLEAPLVAAGVALRTAVRRLRLTPWPGPTGRETRQGMERGASDENEDSIEPSVDLAHIRAALRWVAARGEGATLEWRPGIRLRRTQDVLLIESHGRKIRRQRGCE